MAVFGTLSLVAASLTLASPITASDPQQAGGTTYTVLAGFEDVEADGLEVEAFLPEDVTVKVSDTVDFRFTILEPHTVTFLSGQERPSDFIQLPDGRGAINPAVFLPSGDPSAYDGTQLISSGLTPPDAGPEGFSYPVTFTAPGTFEYVCLIHPFMTGTVTVVDPDAPAPPTPQEVIAAGQAQKQQFIDEMEAFRQQLGAPVVTTRPDGTREHVVRAGISTQKVDLLHFDRPQISIMPGDTVTWTWEVTGAPHNAYFLPAGQQPLPPFVPEPQPDGPPNLLLNPAVFQPVGGDVHQPGQVFNSGMRFSPVVPPPPGFAPAGTYSLTFNQPGTYTYVCNLHFPQGMAGTVTVQTPPGAVPPSVGGVTPSPLAMAGTAITGLALLLGGGLLWLRRARS